MSAHHVNKPRWYPRHVVLWGSLWLCASLIVCIAMVFEAARHSHADTLHLSYDQEATQAQHCRSAHATDEDCDG